MPHRNAKLTPGGRLLHYPAPRAGLDADPGGRGSGRVSFHRREVDAPLPGAGHGGLQETSSAPRRSPAALGAGVVEAILSLRRQLGAGPHRIAHELGLAPSTVYGVLKRHGVSVLRQFDRITRSVIRYERAHPGELVHLDVKKFERIPEGGSKRFDEGFAENGAGRTRPGPKRGHDFVHVAVDDHSRYAYAEALPDEKGETTAGFLARTVLAFATVGITIQRVLTDNGGSYRLFAFQVAASEFGIGRRYTRPYRPQTNGKAEAFNKTLQREWAYRCPYGSNQERLPALQPFLDDYNFARPHTAIGNRPPASRL